MPEKPTAWALLVVSSDQQSETLGAQEQWARSTAKASGWQITREWKGVSSGVAGTRQLLKDLIEELRRTPKPDRPKRLLMVRLDRMGRGDGFETINAFSEIRKLGVLVHTREDGDVSVAKASDAILPVIKSIVSAIENEIRSDRVRAGHARRRAAGKHLGLVPYGTVLVDGKPVAYEPEAAVVRDVFRLLGDGWGLTRIANHVRQYAPPKRLENGGERRLLWRESTIRSLFGSEIIRTLVVSPEAVGRAESARADHLKFRPTGEWRWPLRGAVRCTCGALLVGHATGVKPYRARYYRCRRHPLADPRQGFVTRPGHRADALEASFVSILRGLAADPKIIVRPKGPSVTALREKEASIRQRMARLEARRRRACEFAEDGVYTAVELHERLSRIDAERRATGTELSEVIIEIASAANGQHSAISLAEMLAKLPDRWPTLPEHLQQSVARAISATIGGLWADPERRGLLIPGYARAARGFVARPSPRARATALTDLMAEPEAGDGVSR